jgi:hypothetical protein
MYHNTRIMLYEITFSDISSISNTNKTTDIRWFLLAIIEDLVDIFGLNFDIFIQSRNYIIVVTQDLVSINTKLIQSLQNHSCASFVKISEKNANMLASMNNFHSFFRVRKGIIEIDD